MMAAEIIQLEGKVVGETGELSLDEQVQDAELSVQIAFVKLRIKNLKFVLEPIKSITSSCGSGVK